MMEQGTKGWARSERLRAILKRIDAQRGLSRHHARRAMLGRGRLRLALINACREELAARREADPDSVTAFESRMAKLADVRKRERDRFETKVLGYLPPPPPVGPRPRGMSKAEWRIEKKRRQQVALVEQSLPAKWSHKQGTPETLEHASRTHDDALIQMQRNGTIDAEQVEWAAQIANVHRSIESDVGIKVASLEARVDGSRSSRHLVGEGLQRVRLHHAYTIWREALPAPKALVLDMIVGDTVGYTVAARRHRVHNRTAKRCLIEAIDAWPVCVSTAYRAIARGDLARLNEAA